MSMDEVTVLGIAHAALHKWFVAEGYEQAKVAADRIEELLELAITLEYPGAKLNALLDEIEKIPECLNIDHEITPDGSMMVTCHFVGKKA